MYYKLGSIDDVDVTYVNSAQIGTTSLSNRLSHPAVFPETNKHRKMGRNKCVGDTLLRRSW
ncbi:hypothetical protein EH223_00895 [candidate division KSB1 bacterium]|nr:hypothetical protein [candidate division KSB1 bacterium]RQW07209.1 MAG: hypothetical protein EH223_00895 [candidate division KSB1 bacterium]